MNLYVVTKACMAMYVDLCIVRINKVIFVVCLPIFGYVFLLLFFVSVHNLDPMLQLLVVIWAYQYEELPTLSNNARKK